MKVATVEAAGRAGTAISGETGGALGGVGLSAASAGSVGGAGGGGVVQSEVWGRIMCSAGPENYRERRNTVPRKADNWQEGKSLYHEEPGKIFGLLCPKG